MQQFNLQTSTDDLEVYLRKKDWLTAGEKVNSISLAGEGNMNVVLRVKTNQRSFILKQSRDYVNKYPDISAPIDRIKTEKAFYSAVTSAEMQKCLPEILGADLENYTLLIEDLGTAEDMTVLYQEGYLASDQLKTLVQWLSQLHKVQLDSPYPKNLELRILNHQHIFVLPYLEDNGFDLDSIQPGLADLALPYQRDERLKKIIFQEGKRYLSEGSVLIHGDFYPGSWLRNANQVFIIDPEFSFLGYPEFDLGVFLAHTVLVGMNYDVLASVQQDYKGAVHWDLVRRVAGIEILRRLIGLAQLPLQRSIKEKDKLLKWAYEQLIQ